MKALVVYESMFGNTELVARAIAAGLRETAQVDLVEVTQAPLAPGDDVDLVVAGGPTHAFSMSRMRTRADAISRGATQGSEGFGLREWLAALPSGRHHEKLATFDTRAEQVRRFPGSAARGAARVGKRHGFVAAAESESFYVLDVDGPLVDGELERATEWGRALAAAMSTANA
jgi:hypothetical protein